MKIKSMNSKTYIAQNLFGSQVYAAAESDPDTLTHEKSGVDYNAKLDTLLSIWRKSRNVFIRWNERKLTLINRSLSESTAEQGFIRSIAEDIFSFHIANNITLKMRGAAATEAGNKAGNQRPDMILFDSKAKHDAAVAGDMDGVRFCREATLILDAKKFSKGIGSDDDGVREMSSTATQDIAQVERYIRGYDKPYGVLTNGRDWRLVRRGDINSHLTFHLVDFLESERLFLM